MTGEIKMSKFVSFFGIFPLLAQELTSPFRTGRARGKWAEVDSVARTLLLSHPYQATFFVVYLFLCGCV